MNKKETDECRRLFQKSLDLLSDINQHHDLSDHFVMIECSKEFNSEYDEFDIEYEIRISGNAGWAVTIYVLNGTIVAEDSNYDRFWYEDEDFMERLGKLL